MTKILFVNGKAHLKIGGKKIPISESIYLSPDLEGSDVIREDIVYINEKAIVKSFFIGRKEFTSDLKSTNVVELEDIEQVVEEKIQFKELSGKLFINFGDYGNTYFFEINRDYKFKIEWREIPKEFDDMHNCNVDAEIINETVSKIIFDENTFMDNYAKAPYNFVPLNEKLVEAQNLVPPSLNKFESDKFSGYIKLGLVTKTPLFIRGENEKFFMVKDQNEKPLIPGSSLRGMIRTLVEIASFGKFDNSRFDDKRLSHRGMADKSSLKNDYNNAIAETPLTGYLIFDEVQKKYLIYPVDAQPFTQRTFIENSYVEDNGWKVFTGKMESKDQNGNINWQKTKQKHFQFVPIDTNASPLPVNKDAIKAYTEDETAAKDYEQGKNTNEYYDVLVRLKKEANKFKEGIPVFYEAVNGEVTSFGHTRFYRVPYLFSISQHVDLGLKPKKTIDFSESIFGTTECAGRLFFENARTESDDVYEPGGPFQPKILSSPKPTTFQHYIDQSPLKKDTPQKELKTWNNKDAKIRGYKLYWHRKTTSDNSNNNEYASWVEKAGKKTKSHPDPIKPIKVGVAFISHIRFENLSKEEIGSLLFVLNLPKNSDTKDDPKNCCHKLGMGKPLGLGSVEITPTLFITKRAERYQSLFDISAWNKATKEETDLDKFKNAFAQFVDKELNKKQQTEITYTSDNLWTTPRLAQLKTMLTFEHDINDDDWLERTRYMDINKKEFRSRPVLPEPNEVIKPETYKNC